MSKLIKCPTCGNDVSENAPACPRCGEIINEKTAPYTGTIDMKDPVHFVGVMISIFVIIFIVIAVINKFISDC